MWDTRYEYTLRSLSVFDPLLQIKLTRISSKDAAVQAPLRFADVSLDSGFSKR